MSGLGGVLLPQLSRWAKLDIPWIFEIGWIDPAKDKQNQKKEDETRTQITNKNKEGETKNRRRCYASEKGLRQTFSLPELVVFVPVGPSRVGCHGNHGQS